jgi:hypothetical protein
MARQDELAGDAGNIGQDVMHLDALRSLLQRLLHVYASRMRGAVLDELGAMAQQSPQGAHFGVGAERRGEQAQAVQLLQPERFASPWGIDSRARRTCGQVRA